MKKKNIWKRGLAGALALVMVLSLAACGGKTTAKGGDDSAEKLKGIYEALIAPDSDYSQNKAMYAEYYPEVEYSETLGEDRITLSVKANGNEYITDATWDYVLDGDYLTAEISDEDITGIYNVTIVGDAIGDYFGLDSDLVSGYLNGLGVLEIESDNFSMTENASAGTTTYKLSIAGPWDMKELDQMVVNEKIIDPEPLGSESVSQSASIGKIRMMANGSADNYKMLVAEYGELDDLAYQSISNVISMRQPAGYEDFLSDFSELKDLETASYQAKFDPEEDIVTEMMGEYNEKYSYVLISFGGEGSDEDGTADVPSAEAFADFYYRTAAGLEQETAGASLKQAATACDLLAFAAGNELWQADAQVLQNNMQEAWNSLTEEEQNNYNANIPALDTLLRNCFRDWEGSRAAFEEAGVAETMDELLADDSAEWSWEMVCPAKETNGYTHDPQDNPVAMRDIVVNPDAVYGFSPSDAEDSTLKEYVDSIDWTDPEQVAELRAQRQEYHDSLDELYDMVLTMVDEDTDIETIARTVSKRRNELRLEAYEDDPEGLEQVKQRNKEVYGDEFGPDADSLYEKYGSWEMVLLKALGTNAGMDACLGFYDEYYYLYDLEDLRS